MCPRRLEKSVNGSCQSCQQGPFAKLLHLKCYLDGIKTLAMIVGSIHLSSKVAITRLSLFDGFKVQMFAIVTCERRVRFLSLKFVCDSVWI